VASHVSATDVRQRVEHGKPVRGLVPPRVEEYITKQALYRLDRRTLYT
jgi:nicotinic acid mononucleotide adenylyltransferase